MVRLKAIATTAHLFLLLFTLAARALYTAGLRLFHGQLRLSLADFGLQLLLARQHQVVMRLTLRHHALLLDS